MAALLSREDEKVPMKKSETWCKYHSPLLTPIKMGKLRSGGAQTSDDMC